MRLVRHSTPDHDRPVEGDGDQEPAEEQRRDLREEPSPPLGGHLPSWAFLVAAVLVLALLVALLVTPLNV